MSMRAKDEVIRLLRAGRWHGRQWRRRPSTLAFYSRFIEPGDLVFDVGANIGSRTDAFLRLGARVVAVEPQASCVAVLKRRFGSNPRFRVVPQALGDAPGERELYVADKPELTSLAPDWITAVRGSGRFGARVWSATDRVAVTTLDRLIAEHGVPAFCKIDVEGFELQVVSGLSRPIDTISLEFHPEFLDSTFKAIEHLAHLGARSFNYSIAETMSLAPPGWVDDEALREQLRRIPPPLLVGDVHARTAPPGTGNGRGEGGLHSGARRRGAEGGREGGAR